jgi:hypothetical protein
LVVLGGVDGELAGELAGGVIDDAHVEVVDEHDDGGAAVFVVEADVMEAAVAAQATALDLMAGPCPTRCSRLLGD